ncbi:hypothetical protein R9C00_11335 [Flammeovirgaceae bacterium SG7u.111]|nr:hypothetical protein [Flammeovirgaceae bacterium SG7u.132]WPO38044.1 hypothetical protein R9C00_11335 [Flammeovirgaceae bacterium SG7u.111]
MKNILFLVPLLLFFVSCENSKKGGEENSKHAEPEVLSMSVDEFFAKPEGLAGKEIALKGTVVHVCKHGGKRLHMISSENGKQLKVEAGENRKFEREMEGDDVLVTGKVVEERIDLAYVDKHEAEAIQEHAGDEEQLEKVKKSMDKMRKQIAESKTGYISKLSLECTGVVVKEL